MIERVPLFSFVTVYSTGLTFIATVGVIEVKSKPVQAFVFYSLGFIDPDDLEV